MTPEDLAALQRVCFDDPEFAKMYVMDGVVARLDRLGYTVWFSGSLAAKAHGAQIERIGDADASIVEIAHRTQQQGEHQEYGRIFGKALEEALKVPIDDGLELYLSRSGLAGSYGYFDIGAKLNKKKLPPITIDVAVDTPFEEPSFSALAALSGAHVESARIKKTYQSVEEVLAGKVASMMLAYVVEEMPQRAAKHLLHASLILRSTQINCDSYRTALEKQLRANGFNDATDFAEPGFKRSYNVEKAYRRVAKSRRVLNPPTFREATKDLVEFNIAVASGEAVGRTWLPDLHTLVPHDQAPENPRKPDAVSHVGSALVHKYKEKFVGRSSEPTKDSKEPLSRLKARGWVKENVASEDEVPIDIGDPAKPVLKPELPVAGEGEKPTRSAVTRLWVSKSVSESISKRRLSKPSRP